MSKVKTLPARMHMQDEKDFIDACLHNEMLIESKADKNH
jgi:hypothetical protein